MRFDFIDVIRLRSEAFTIDIRSVRRREALVSVFDAQGGVLDIDACFQLKFGQNVHNINLFGSFQLFQA